MLSGQVFLIHSSFVHGYVGTAAAVLPLQLLDFDVYVINSVQYSNRSDSSTKKGVIMSLSELVTLYNGLKENGVLNNYTHVLMGYICNYELLNKMADVVYEMKQINPNLVFLCDPIIGDNNKWYVTQDMIQIYKERLFPKTDIITPNCFELAALYGQPIKSEEDIFKAIQVCHDDGVKIVVLSSITSFVDKKKLFLYASSKVTGELIKIEFNRLRGVYYGTGDLFSSLFLGWYTKLNDLEKACEHSLSTILHVLNKTLEASLAKQVEIDALPFTEIQLVPSKMDIMNPKIIVKAERLA